MVDVRTQITINKPLEEVATFVANPDNASIWYDNISSAQWQSPAVLKEGAQITFKAHFLGKELIYTYEVVQYISNSILVMQTKEGPFPMKTTYQWQNAGSAGTLMLLQNTGNPKGFSKLISPLMSAMMQRANNKDLKKLKTILEKEI